MVQPLASRSRIRETQMRWPRMHGLPKHTWELMEIRDNRSGRDISVDPPQFFSEADAIIGTVCGSAPHSSDPGSPHGSLEDVQVCAADWSIAGAVWKFESAPAQLPPKLGAVNLSSVPRLAGRYSLLIHSRNLSQNASEWSKLHPSRWMGGLGYGRRSARQPMGVDCPNVAFA